MSFTFSSITVFGYQEVVMRMRKGIRGNNLNGFFVSLLFLLCILLPSGCSNDGQGSFAPGALETASASFTIRWHDTVDSQDSGSPGKALDCQAAGVAQVVCHVYDTATGDLLVTGGPWSCTAGGGSIDLIPAGLDRTFVALAEDDYGNVIFQGETPGIAIVANEITDNVVINAYRFVPTLVSPDRWRAS
jgi:hypothetical protein